MVATLFQVFLRDPLNIVSHLILTLIQEVGYYDFHFMNVSISSGSSSDLSRAPHNWSLAELPLLWEFYKQEIELHKVACGLCSHDQLAEDLRIVPQPLEFLPRSPSNISRLSYPHFHCSLESKWSPSEWMQMVKFLES